MLGMLGLKPRMDDFILPDGRPLNHDERRAMAQRHIRAQRLRRVFKAAGYGPSEAGRMLARSLAGPSMAGGASGQGGVSFVSNLPQDRFVINQAEFERYTERQDIPQPQQAFNGFGSTNSIRLQNVGVLSLIRVYCQLQIVVNATGTCTLLQGFPYSLAKRLAFNANGQTSILGCSGTTLRARRNRVFRNPAESLELTQNVGVVPAGTYNINFMLDVPVSHNMFSGTGWVLAQNPATSLSCDIGWANQAEVMTLAGGNTTTISGTVYTMISTFAVGQGQVGNAMATIIPDLTVFHGLIDNDYNFPASGVVQAPLIRTSGQLLNYAFNLNNGGSTEIAPTALTEIQFRYGGNRQPRVYNPPQMLLEKNQADYNGLIAVRGLTHTYLDFEVDNPVRDLFLPESLVELLAQVTIPNSVTVNAGAKLRYLEETLYPAV